MKRLSVFLIAALMLILTALPVFANEYGWEEDFEGEIGQISLPEGTPTIDGVIDASEGWSEPKHFDKTNVEGAWGGQTVDLSGELYRAYDDEYFYVAADINIPEYSLCEGKDWIEGNDEGDLPGWDGDVFILSLDPMQALLTEGFGTDPAAWYCIGLFDGGVVRTYRTHINDGEITDEIPAKGNVTADGWMFEAAIPWETICRDVDEVSFGYVSITPEDIVKEGNIIAASVIYYDRRFDPEAEQRITHSRYVTVATVFPDGTPGVMGTPWTIQAHGIFFILDASENAVTDDITSGDTDTIESVSGPADSTEPSVSEVGVSKPGTSKPNSSPSFGSSAAQTLDIGIAVAIGAVAASGIGVACFKKKK